MSDREFGGMSHQQSLPASAVTNIMEGADDLSLPKGASSPTITSLAFITPWPLRSMPVLPDVASYHIPALAADRDTGKLHSPQHLRVSARVSWSCTH